MLVPEEFTALGVTTIGDKARLKQRCKDYLKGKSLDSPVMSKFRELNSKSKSNRNSRKMKLTKRLYIGWKHGHQDLYRLVHPAKGGGQFVQDVNKGCTLSELKSLLIDLYFPRGHCKAGNLHVNEVDATVVNYSGHTLPETIGDDPFTVGLYCDSRKSNPVRIYLQTEKVIRFFL
ncbi:uncharacterized protein LOC128551002 [Mercenaria mercenaria]|uniref:uncharacterized protein LOC128551002 n=1 Tax=Mercenaria mercenaria TaxID=6596 RepID=UPI00234F71AD|nr:uncharacterized protein LOC128551002 [Mercenaria mercenaria]